MRATTLQICSTPLLVLHFVSHRILLNVKLLNNIKMEKVIRDGKVAVLVSHGFGAGWYSWNSEHQQLLFDPKLVEMVEQNRTNEITDEWVKENLGINIYTRGSYGLTIHWLPIGTAFEIDEYDGSESLRIIADLVLVA